MIDIFEEPDVAALLPLSACFSCGGDDEDELACPSDTLEEGIVLPEVIRPAYGEAESPAKGEGDEGVGVAPRR